MLRILAPALFALALFAIALFAVFLPAFHRSLVERKREMIRELTNSAWSILAEYEAEERSGALTREQAQRMAAERVEYLRYGAEGKDYFWLQDMQPRIVMHPYRTDLNGQDVSEFRDPRGAPIFVEFADLVRRQHEGYAEYVWQWKDDPTRLAAKESYIKGFEPWGWVIGTGVYIEDVNREAARVQAALVRTSLGITLVVACLLALVIHQSLRTERERSEADARLREWTDRYRSLVEATTEGTLLVLDGRCRYANPTLREMLGCGEAELELLELADVLPHAPENASAWAWLSATDEERAPAGPFEGLLRQRGGAPVPCTLALSPIALADRAGVILLAKRATHTGGREAGVGGASEARVSELLGTIERLQGALLFLHEPVEGAARPPAECTPGEPIRSVAERMSALGAEECLVRAESGDPLGIVTDRDLRERVVSAGLDPREPVRRVMSAPLVTIAGQASAYEALLLMETRGVRRLAVVDASGGVTGIVRARDLLAFRGYGPLVLSSEIARAASPEEVVRACRRIAPMAGALLTSGAHPERVTRLITSAFDAAAERLTALALERDGPSPVPFALVALGSHARQELTLHSDQDNALIWLPPDDPEEREAARLRMLALGEFVCEWLDRAGLPLCQGAVMARNPRWNLPLDEWKRCFGEWIRRAEPKQLLDVSIFFDLREVAGAGELVRELRAHITRELAESPSFAGHFAQNALQFRPPVSLLGRVLGGGEPTGLVNLKDATIPITAFARLYALRHGVESVATLERLRDLVAVGAIPETTRQETVTAWRFLTGLRLSRHAEALAAGARPDNTVSRRDLGHIEETVLAQSFAHIAAIQKRIGYDFLGGQ